ncbi:FlgT C-terminal domain-containing protein [Microbacterium sp. ET2]|uniref:FlgT C-terminal domain-containing protein n=1 Tax=Microbacterium albipurpureum TaxID=3050384 RepID=UPI00259D2DD8|nr:FlgT C-terminal domain-containing protein [Microbacterium sp. ET2 (Ac-2212)]WJL97212.1 FlgT C-terminal domain-containing protein [Microbacterium sp. ET2 (Ac-2212)]
MSEENVVAVGKVATIIRDTEIALNIGSADGVEEGDTVLLYRDVTVTDPDSGEILGSVRYPKVRMTVTSVEPRFAVARIGNAGILWSVTLPRKRFVGAGASESPDKIAVSVGEIAEVFRVDPDL